MAKCSDEGPIPAKPVSKSPHTHSQGINHAVAPESERRNCVLLRGKSWSRSLVAMTPHSSPNLTKIRGFPIKFGDHAQRGGRAGRQASRQSCHIFAPTHIHIVLLCTILILDFSNFKVLMQAKKVLKPSASQTALLYRSAKWGRSGETLSLIHI